MPASRAVNADSFRISTPSEHEIRMTRLFAAPRALVFEAMSKPEHIRRWWGNLGEGYSVPTCEVDLRVGGKWRFVNRTPTGELVTFYGEFREIDPPRRVVHTEFYEPFPDAESVVTSTLTEENGKTRLTVTVRYPSPEVRDMVLGSGMEHGAAASYDALEEVLGELQAS